MLSSLTYRGLGNRCSQKLREVDLICMQELYLIYTVTTERLMTNAYWFSEHLKFITVNLIQCSTVTLYYVHCLGIFKLSLPLTRQGYLFPWSLFIVSLSGVHEGQGRTIHTGTSTTEYLLMITSIVKACSDVSTIFALKMSTSHIIWYIVHI